MDLPELSHHKSSTCQTFRCGPPLAQHVFRLQVSEGCRHVLGKLSLLPTHSEVVDVREQRWTLRLNLPKKSLYAIPTSEGGARFHAWQASSSCFKSLLLTVAEPATAHKRRCPNCRAKFADLHGTGVLPQRLHSPLPWIKSCMEMCTSVVD